MFHVMESQPPPAPSPSQPSVEVVQRARVSEMDVHIPVIEDPSSALWDLGDLLSFTDDDHFSISFDSGYDHGGDHGLVNVQPVDVLPETVSGSDRVRKRDPRLTCSNFLAGRVPCACPEMDALLAEEEAETGKKRAKKVRAGVTTIVCQVPGCGADISGLKGYHRRHRVCLQCANATAVVFDGDSKRYCQQCGKFHVLSDFDEGRRSCRRKLERHNNRRRRKPIDKVAVENELQGGVITDEVVCDDEAGKDNLCSSSQLTEKEALLESEDGRVSTLCSDPDSQNVHSVASGEVQVEGGKDNSNHSLSPSFHDNKSVYLPVCPSGRISFKLYDWNPAEFPRRLRHQIFEWLSNMPVELEGYIRPGCTIFTVFIAMPKIMWAKILEDPISYVQEFVVSPGSMLAGRADLLVYLNNMIFRVAKNGTSVMKVKTELKAPRLHYVHPTCFEAGKPMEFVACGSNLLQPKFRFLVSFAGKYLMYDYCVASSRGNTEEDSTCSFDHQLYKIHVPHTEPNVFGPAFIEVENESGISNFIPVLIGDKEICSEMKIMQQKFNVYLSQKGPLFAAMGAGSDSLEVSALRQTAFSEFLVDVAWLLRQPASESFQQMMTSSQIQRFNYLLPFLMHIESITILERVLDNLTILTDNIKLSSVVNSIGDCDMRLLKIHMNCARNLLRLKVNQGQSLVLQSENTGPIKHVLSQSCSQDYTLAGVSANKQDMKTGAYGNMGLKAGSSSGESDETVSLLNREIVMNVDLFKELPRNSCRFNYSSTIVKSRRTMFLLGTIVVCFGVCAVILHPHKVGELTITIRRCLFD